MELPEFIQIMAKTREAEQEASFWGYDAPKHKTKGDEAVPLHHLTAAYRRKHTLDTVMDPTLRQVYAVPPGTAGRHVHYGMTCYAALHVTASGLYVAVLAALSCVPLQQ